MRLKNHLRIFPIAWLACAWLTTPALAEPPPPPEKPIDLTFRLPGNPDTWIRPNVRWDAAWSGVSAA